MGKIFMFQRRNNHNAYDMHNYSRTNYMELKRETSPLSTPPVYPNISHTKAEEAQSSDNKQAAAAAAAAARVATLHGCARHHTIGIYCEAEYSEHPRAAKHFPSLVKSEQIATVETRRHIRTAVHFCTYNASKAIISSDPDPRPVCIHSYTTRGNANAQEKLLRTYRVKYLLASITGHIILVGCHTRYDTIGQRRRKIYGKAKASGVVLSRSIFEFKHTGRPQDQYDTSTCLTSTSLATSRQNGWCFQF